jgi:predicted DNA-binding transcriptional regulator AlpA
METPNTAALSGQARVAALEKIPAAARRMGISTSSVYRELKAGRLAGPIVKVGERASAIPSASVDAWISARIAEASGDVQTSTHGGHHG